MSQAGIVDAYVHAFVLCFDGCEHGQNLILVGQVTLVRHQNATVACALTLCCQFLKANTHTHKVVLGLRDDEAVTSNHYIPNCLHNSVSIQGFIKY